MSNAVEVQRSTDAAADPELAAEREIEQSAYSNEDLRPVPKAKRTWHTYNYAALWMSIAHGIPTYYLASGLIDMGMSWVQAVGIIALGNLIVTVPLLLNSHAGTKYGIPFPVFARAAFGLRGANVPALIRAISACGWFGIQTWVGGQAIYTLMGVILGDGWRLAAEMGGQPWTVWLSFGIFWLIQMALVLRGIESIRQLENWAAPLILIVAGVLLVWVMTLAGGLGPIASAPSSLGWGPEFWSIFPGALMGMIAFYATMSVNISDFTRFAKSQKAQMVGQASALTPTVALFTTMGALTTSATVEVWGEAIWDPVELVGMIPNIAAVLFAMLCIIVATVAVNVAANTVGPAYDFSNAFPRVVTFKIGGLITGVIAILMQPWNLLASSDLYIFVWLGMTGTFLGSVAGILVAEYWLIRRRHLAVDELYSPTGRYWYRGGFNWRALAAMAVALVLSVGGAHSAAGGPFPEDGLIALLRPLYDYNWLVAFTVGLLVHWALARLAPADSHRIDAAERRTTAPTTASAPEPQEAHA
ncbi:NCS1 family nucleobase:cation symporter-1 [Agrococcus sp. HG114]|uniref:NCS1 family nucleobase:cation symporter-1 n=1 Tax=Agrococcus sp. HG114 TaxID=2969757 RepID=UPI00215B692C|nr:NCS1 family nucleobase:cation symporter-1 [Agrococcus sp. HG114]MCR8669789.1 NCS1 family nucleobase:cation symporter-1 [Agrococcus sp. HG114]